MPADSAQTKSNIGQTERQKDKYSFAHFKLKTS